MEESLDSLAPALADRIDDVFSQWDNDDGPGCAIGIYWDGSLAYAKGYGMSNLEHGVPITPGSIFHVASISKQFAAHCLALLETDGKLSFDDDIRQYVPEVPDYGQEITLQHLMHHTSGLRDQWELLRLSGWREDDVIADDDVLDICRKQTALNFKPGSRHLYSNTGYTLMGIVIRRVTGQSLRQFAQERIFGPLEMNETHFHDDHNEIVPRRTHGYKPCDEGRGWRISNPIFDTTGATSLQTTVEDLFRWDQYLAGWLADPANEALTRPAILTDGEATTYACGLTYGDIGDLKTVGHSGSDAGYRAHYLRVPERDTAVAIFCNASTIVPGELAERVLATVLEIELDQAESGERFDPGEAGLERWTGVYRGSKTGMFMDVALIDGALQLPMLFDTKLVPVADGVFHPEGPRRMTVTFEHDGDRPTGVTFSGFDRFEYLGKSDGSSTAIGDYTGIFESEELATSYRIGCSKGSLVWQRRRFDDKPLRHLIDDVFASGDTCFLFERSPDGDVEGFTVSMPRAFGMRFQQI